GSKLPRAAGRCFSPRLVLGSNGATTASSRPRLSWAPPTIPPWRCSPRLRASCELAHRVNDLVDLLLRVVVVRRHSHARLDAFVREVVERGLAGAGRRVYPPPAKLRHQNLAVPAVDRERDDRAAPASSVENPDAVELGEPLTQGGAEGRRPRGDYVDPDREGVANRRGRAEEGGVRELPILEA